MLQSVNNYRPQMSSNIVVLTKQIQPILNFVKQQNEHNFERSLLC